MTGRVLLIEDDIRAMESMFHLLTTYGYFPLRARSGEQGLKLAGREPPDLIISDIHMPLLNGYEVARRIRADAALSAIPMIALVSSLMPEDRENALAAGFDGYLCKPFSPQALARHVESFLRPGFRAGMPAEAPPADPPVSKAQRRTVLVVDDTPANITLSTRLLEHAGYRVVAAKGISEALRLARSDPPDLILSDVVMVDGSGYEFIRAVKADSRLRSIPFVFNTASMIIESARVKGLALGAAAFLFRPMDSQQMLREIEDCLQVSS